MTKRPTSKRPAKGNTLKIVRPMLEAKYALELARGASVIASTRSEESLAQAVNETLTDFLANHGSEEFDGFVHVLADKLIQRDRADAAGALANWRPSRPEP
jgi:hypothetical protein